MIQQASQTPSAPSVPRDTFSYHDSLCDEHSIRYLVIQPAKSQTEVIVCTLYTSYLEDVPPFEAISYVWGTPVKNQPICCNGKIVHVTSNLRDVLRQVRHRNRPRTLWVDSICINQSDAKEKGHQVSLMSRIYHKSDCTLICLGNGDSNHAKLAADLVASVNTMIDGVFEKADFAWTPNSFPFANEDEPLLRHQGWDAFAVLLQQPWFKRGWVVQEAALSSKAVVLWAGEQINWMTLVRNYVWCIRRILKLPNISELWLSDLHVQGFYDRRTREAITFRPEGGIEPLNCLEIFEHARWLGVTDPRDRIYAFLGLVDYEKLLPSLQLSYEKPHLSVYHEFASELLQRTQDLDILHFVHNDNNALRHGFPSWVPCWDTRLYSTYTGTLNNYSKNNPRVTSQTSSPRVVLSPDRTTLGVRISMIDSVSFSSSPLGKNTTTPDDITLIWESFYSRSGPSIYPCSAIQAFTSLFRCGIYRGRLSEWKMLEAAYTKLLQRDISRGDDLYEDAMAFHTLRMQDVDNKTLIQTERGYYGLSPKSTKKGDICCWIYGTRSPFILRPMKSEGDFQLVGSAMLLGATLDQNGNPEVQGLERYRTSWASADGAEKNVFIH